MAGTSTSKSFCMDVSKGIGHGQPVFLTDGLAEPRPPGFLDFRTSVTIAAAKRLPKGLGSVPRRQRGPERAASGPGLQSSRRSGRCMATSGPPRGASDSAVNASAPQPQLRREELVARLRSPDSGDFEGLVVQVEERHVVVEFPRSAAPTLPLAQLFEVAFIGAGLEGTVRIPATVVRRDENALSRSYALSLEPGAGGELHRAFLGRRVPRVQPAEPFEAEIRGPSDDRAFRGRCARHLGRRPVRGRRHGPTSRTCIGSAPCACASRCPATRRRSTSRA